VGWELVVGGGGLIVVGEILSGVREFRTQRDAASMEALAVKSEADLAVTVGDAITPIAALLGRISGAHPNDRPELQSQLCQRIVDAVGEICGPTRTRAVFFGVEKDQLKARAWAGRGDEPRTVFQGPDSPAHRLLKAHESVLVPDTNAAPAGLTIRPGADYHCFLSVAVYSTVGEFGLLSIDTVEARALDNNDIHTAKAFAQLLAAGLSAPVTRD
jgi:hypothetical protein